MSGPAVRLRDGDRLLKPHLQLMSHQKLAIVDVHQPDEEAAFHGWLTRNRDRVLAISDNGGCGCCVHIFRLELPDDIEPMPSEGGGELESLPLHHASARDEIIDYYLSFPPSTAGKGT